MELLSNEKSSNRVVKPAVSFLCLPIVRIDAEVRVKVKLDAGGGRQTGDHPNTLHVRRVELGVVRCRELTTRDVIIQNKMAATLNRHLGVLKTVKNSRHKSLTPCVPLPRSMRSEP